MTPSISTFLPVLPVIVPDSVQNASFAMSTDNGPNCVQFEQVDSAPCCQFN